MYSPLLTLTSFRNIYHYHLLCLACEDTFCGLAWTSHEKKEKPKSMNSDLQKNAYVTLVEESTQGDSLNSRKRI